MFFDFASLDNFGMMMESIVKLEIGEKVMVNLVNLYNCNYFWIHYPIERTKIHWLLKDFHIQCNLHILNKLIIKKKPALITIKINIVDFSAMDTHDNVFYSCEFATEAKNVTFDNQFCLQPSSSPQPTQIKHQQKNPTNYKHYKSF